MNAAYALTLISFRSARVRLCPLHSFCDLLLLIAFKTTTIATQQLKKNNVDKYDNIRLQIITLSQKKQTETVVLQLICLLTVVYYFIIRVALFYGQLFISLISHFQSHNANPQPTLFRVTNIWRNATLSEVRCKCFTFYKVVW